MTSRKRRVPPTRVVAAVPDADNVARTLQAKRLKITTRKTYSSKLNRLSEWLSLHYPDCVSREDERSKIKLPLEKSVVLEFFGSICFVAAELDKLDVNTGDLGVPLSSSCVKGYRSALVDLYKNEQRILNPDTDRELNILLEGYDKLINDLRKRGLMKISEGKQYLKSSGYSLLASTLMKSRPEKSGQTWATTTFSWAYFVLMWNLMSRSESVENIMLQHLDWVEDSLVIEEQGHKGDQTGADKYWKHIYANPYDPHICPILALAVLLFSYPDRSTGGKQQLFAGSNNKTRFGDILRKTLKQLSESEQQQLGSPTGDIAAHSLRKGSSTYTLAQVSGPNPVTVFLRMGQSLGRLKDRYIHYGEGADQLCGRMVCGLPFDRLEFGIRTGFPFFLASLFYHESFLRESLPETHPIFLARVFTHNPQLDMCRSGTVLCIGLSGEQQLKCTGIPPHLSIARELNEVKSQLGALETSITQWKCEMNDDLPGKIALKVGDYIRESFNVAGVAPVTIRDIDTRMEKLRDEITACMRGLITQPVLQSDTNEQENYSPVDWQSWDWRDGLLPHPVPVDWEFPTRINMKTLWDLWNYGDRSRRIRPYRYLASIDINPQYKMRFTRAKMVMTHINSIIKTAQTPTQRCWPPSATSFPSIEFDAAFEATYAKMLVQLYGDKAPGRPEEISYGRLYNLLCKYRRNNKEP
ncbi:hypothetical protein PHMEG_00025674 [Phytophthora megakarya]|uniref:Uncharacterized protein n=1 Tax=Phytophthora megakarya TaxID=4795 RepID=A0A225VE17_9STRA|nr:hypothetical protein PHMEG_00025674 [Phytophthora megakarya]